jgi:hypothetical protein
MRSGEAKRREASTSACPFATDATIYVSGEMSQVEVGNEESYGSDDCA